MSYKEEIGCDHFKSVVKVKYYNEGSGIIFLPTTDSFYAYVLTAKHNFKDENENLIPLEKIDNNKIEIGFKEYDEDDFINVSKKEIIYLDNIDLAIIIVDIISLDKNILRLTPILNVLDIGFSHCIFKGYPKISNNEIQCIESKYHAKTSRKLFTITTDKNLSSFDYSEFDNTMGFSGSGLLTAFNKKPVLTGIIIEVNNSFNEIDCIDLKEVLEDINNKLEEKGYKKLTLIDSETIDNIKSNEIESINNSRVSLSTISSINEQHKEIIKKLEVYDIEGAKELLKEVSKPSGETYRLNALVSLTDKNISTAFNYIEKAKAQEVVPNDLEFVKGLIYYFSSIDEKGYSKITPYPIDKIYVKNDKESQENIKKAQETFFELSSKNESIDYDVWYLGSLHLSSLEKVLEKSKEFIERNSLHYGAITYITAFNFDIELSFSIEKLEEIENKSINNIIDLVNCYNHQKLFEKTIILLDDNNISFKDNTELLEKSYINTYMLDGKFEEALNIVKLSTNESIKKLEKLIRVESYYQKAQWDELINYYNEDLTIENLYNICKVKAIQNDWEFVSENGDKLLDKIPSFAILDLIVTAKYNTQKYQDVLDMLEKFKYLYGALNEKFIRIRANCFEKKGDLISAINDFKNIEQKDINDYNSLISLNKKIGSDDEASKWAFRLTKDKDITDDNSVQLVATLESENPYIAKKIIGDIDFSKVSDRLKPSLVASSLKLNIADKEIMSVIDTNPHFIKFHIDDFTKWMSEEEKIAKRQIEDYKNREFSYHFLNDSRFFVNNIENKSNCFPFIRSGNKNNFIKIDESIENIYCDISSLLLIDSLDIWELVLDSYILYIPDNWAAYLNEIGNKPSLKKFINHNIQERKILLTEYLENEELKECDNNILELNLRSLIKTTVEENSILLIDDRFINKYAETDKAKLYAINDLLYSFLKNGLISKDVYFQKLLLIREKNLMYIPFDKDELIYYLQKAKIKDGKLIETAELKVVRKHFASTIQNLKYLSIEEQNNMSETFYFTNVNKLIENVYFELWNIDKDKWDIYFEYLQENFYILNLGYFIRDRAPKLNENLLVAISLSSLVYVSFFMINKDHDKYLDIIERSFLEPILYGNKPLLKEFIRTLIFQLLQKYEYEEKEQKILDSLQSDFIKKLPFKIRNEIIDDVTIRDKFDFIQPMNLWDKTVDFDNLLVKIERVLNKGVKEKLEDFEIYVDKGDLLIKNLITSDIRDFSDDFYILSQDKSLRKKIIDKNEKWIDCKEIRKKEIRKNIQSIKDPIKRFKKFEKYKKLSPEHYYESLFNESEKTNLIDFKYVIPEDISLVSNYFRFELINDYEKSEKIAINELLKDKNLSRALHRIFALPGQLSPQVLKKVAKLSHKKQVEILKRFHNTVATPLNIFQLIKLINKTAKNKAFSKRIIRRILNKFSKNALVKVKAYLAVYRYMYYRFKKEFNIEKNLLYVLSWGHTDRIFRNFLALGIDLIQLEEIFTQKTKFDSSEIFDFENRINVLHTFELDDVSFLFKGLNYALQDDFERIDISSYRKYALMKDSKMPSYKLFKDYSLFDNKCNSFMSKDYGNFFSYIDKDEKDAFSNRYLKRVVEDTLNDLKETPDKIELYNILKAIFGNQVIYTNNQKDLLDLMQEIDFKIISDDYYLAVLNFISIQNIYFKDEVLHNNIRNEVTEKCKELIIEDELGPYFDILVYLSIPFNKEIEDRVLYFTNLLRSIETDSNRALLKVALKNIVLQLPFNQSNILSEYLVELRSKK